METTPADDGDSRMKTNKSRSQNPSDTNTTMESFQDGGQQHNTNSEATDYSMQMGSSHTNSDMNTFTMNSTDQNMNSDNFNRLNDSMNPSSMPNYSHFNRSGFSMQHDQHGDFNNQQAQFHYSQGNMRPSYPSMGKPGPGMSPSRPGMMPHQGMNMMSPPGPGYNQPPRMMSGQSVSQQSGPTPTLNQLLQTSSSNPRFPNNYPDYPPGSRPGVDMGSANMPYNMQQNWNSSHGRGMPPSIGSYPPGAMPGSSTYRNQTDMNRRQPSVGSGNPGNSSYTNQGGQFPNQQFSPNSNFNMMSGQPRPSGPNQPYHPQIHSQYNQSSGPHGGFNQSGPPSSGGFSQSGPPSSAGFNQSGPPSSQANPMYLSPQHSRSANQSPNSHPSQPGTPQSGIQQSPVHNQTSPVPTQNSDSSRSNNKVANDDSDSGNKLDSSSQDEGDSLQEPPTSTSLHPSLSNIRNRVPSPAGSTGSRSNTPASLPGNHPGSPMPPRPPSGQLDGQGRLSQSPMATQGFNQQIMPPPIGPNQGPYGAGPPGGKMGSGGPMPGHFPPYNSQYPNPGNQGNYSRSSNMPGMPTSGGMSNFPPQNMYNGPNPMAGGNNPMYSNMPRHNMPNSNYNNSYGQGTMGMNMPNQYGGYNNMGPNGPPQMNSVRPGFNNMPPSDLQNPSKGANAAAAAAQAAMIAAANSAGNMGSIRQPLNPSSRMFTPPSMNHSGPIGQLNHMTVGLGAPPMNNVPNNMNQQPNNPNIVSNSASQNSATTNASLSPKDNHAKINTQPPVTSASNISPASHSSNLHDSTANQNSDTSGNTNCVSQSDTSSDQSKKHPSDVETDKSANNVPRNDSIGQSQGQGVVSKMSAPSETSQVMPPGGENDQTSNSSDSMSSNPNTMASQTPIVTQNTPQSIITQTAQESQTPTAGINTNSVPPFSDEPPEKKKKKSGTIDLSKLYEMGSEPERKLFIDKLLMFNDDKGTPITGMPAISKQPLDLFKLYHCVKERGGMIEVNKVKKWKEICTIVNIGSSASAAFTLKKNYIKYLFAFECHFDRGGMDPQPILAQMEAALAQKREQKNKRAPSPAGSQGSSQDAFRPPSTPNSQGLDPFSPGPGMNPHYMQNDQGMGPMGGMMSHGGMMNHMNPHNMMPPGHMPHHGMMPGSNMMGGMGPNSMMGHGNMPQNAMMGHGNMMRQSNMMGSNMQNAMAGNMPNSMGGNMPNSMGGNMPGNMPNSMGGNMPNSMGGNIPHSMGGNMPHSMGSNMPNSMSGSMPNSMGGNMPNSMSGGNMPNSMGPGNMPNSMGSNMPNSMSGSMPNSMGPGNMPNSMSGNIPSSMGGHMPNSMSGNMPSSMGGSANLPNSTSGPGSMPNSMGGNMPNAMSGGGHMSHAMGGNGNVPNAMGSNMPNSMSMGNNMPYSGPPNSSNQGQLPPGSGPHSSMSSAMSNSSMVGSTPNSSLPGNMPNTNMPSGGPNSQLPGNMPNSSMPSGMLNSSQDNTSGPGNLPNSSMPGSMPNTSFSSGMPNASSITRMPNTSISGNNPNSSMHGGMPNVSSGGMPNSMHGNMPNTSMSGSMPNSSMPGNIPNSSMPGNMPNSMYGNMPHASMHGNMPNTSMHGNMPNSGMHGNMPPHQMGSTMPGNGSNQPGSGMANPMMNAMSGNMSSGMPNMGGSNTSMSTGTPNSMPGGMPNTMPGNLPNSMHNPQMSGNMPFPMGNHSSNTSMPGNAPQPPPSSTAPTSSGETPSSSMHRNTGPISTGNMPNPMTSSSAPNNGVPAINEASPNSNASSMSDVARISSPMSVSSISSTPTTNTNTSSQDTKPPAPTVTTAQVTIKSESVSVQDPFADDMSSGNRSNMPPFSKMPPGNPNFPSRPNMPPFSSSADSSTNDPYRRPEGYPNRPDFNTPNQYPVRPGGQFPFGQQFDTPNRMDSAAPGTPNTGMRMSGPMPNTPQNSFGNRYGNQPMGMRPNGPQDQFSGTPGYHGANYGPRPMGNPDQYPGYQGSYPSPRPPMNREGFGTPNKRYPDMSSGPRDGSQWSPMRYQHNSNYMPPGAPGTPPMGPYGTPMGPRHPRMKSLSKQKASFPPPTVAQNRKEIPFPPNTIEGIHPPLSKRRRLTSKDIGSIEAWRLMMALKSGLLTESTWALDTLNILLFDDSTVSYFNLSHLPGLLDVLLEHFRKCILEVFTDLKEFEDHSKPPELLDNMTSDKILDGVNYTLKSRTDKVVYMEEESKNAWMVEPKTWDVTNDLLADDHLSVEGGNLDHIRTKMESEHTNSLLSKLFSKYHGKHKDQRKVFSKDSVCDEEPPVIYKEKMEVEEELETDKLSPTPEKTERNNFVNSEHKIVDNSESESDSSVNKDSNIKTDNVVVKIEKSEDIEMSTSEEKSENGQSTKAEKEENPPIPEKSYHAPTTYIRTEEERMSLAAMGNRNQVLEDLEEESYEHDTPPLYNTVSSHEELAKRCICISNIFRSLSCIPANGLELSRHMGLMSTLGKLLLLHHKHLPRSKRHKFEKDERIEIEMEESDDGVKEAEWWWSCLETLRENTLVIYANISGKLKLQDFPENVCFSILDGLLHWVVCSSSCARDPMPNMPANSVLSPQRLVLEALCKLCIHDANVDLLVATPPFERMIDLFDTLVKLLANRKEQVTQEFAIVLLSELVQGDSSISRAIALQHQCISLLVDFLETAEVNAHQVAKSQGIGVLQTNPESMGTSLDMLRRSATILVHLARVEDNRTLFVHQQSRLLALVMSQILDQTVAKILSDVLFECSQLS